MITTPDGLLGAVIASESLGLTETMINGAGGCRSRTQIMLHELDQTYRGEKTGCCRSKYYSRQSGIPCTYLNGNDVIFGATDKISDGITSASEATGRRVVLLDTLGASLICTDLEGRLNGRAEPIHMREDLSSMDLHTGYDLTMTKILDSMEIGGGEDRSVNILGYCIMDPGWEYGAEELRTLLSLAGIRVNAIIGCKDDPSKIASCGSASLNIMIHPEYCRMTSDYLKKRFGTPSLRLSAGAPVGYDATRSFVKEVADAMGTDPAPALEYIDRDERRVHGILMNHDRAPSMMHAKGMSMDGDSSTLYPLMKWICEKFGMIPRSIHPTDGEYLDDIGDYLDSIGFGDALAGIPGRVEAVFTDGITALEGRLSHDQKTYVEIHMPRGHHMDLMGRHLIGTGGCRYILDEMFNNHIRFRCGQPTQMEFRP